MPTPISKLTREETISLILRMCDDTMAYAIAHWAPSDKENIQRLARAAMVRRPQLVDELRAVFNGF